MKKQFFIFLLTLLSLFSVKSYAVDCSNTVLEQKTIYKLPGEGYWMQLAGECRLTYTAVGGTRSYMYNLCKRQPEPISDDYDAFPVPAFEGQLYTHPTGGISFYKIDEAVAQGGLNQAVYSDRELRGVYQSLGVLKQDSPDKAVVRVSKGWNAGTFRDYEITRSGSDFSVKPASEVTAVCQNIPTGGLDKETPVISRNGQLIAGRNGESSQTKIYQVETPSGNCRKIASIPNRTTKVSFSFDNKKVMYATRDEATGNGRLMEMNLDSKKVRTISGPNEDAMYMTYRPNGSILYSRNTGNGARESDLIELNPAQTVSDPTKFRDRAIGLLWAQQCQLSIDLDYAEVVGARISGNACRALAVDSAIARLPADFLRLSAADISSSCASPTNQAGDSSSRSGVR